MTDPPIPVAPVYKGATCRGCDTELVFVRTAKGHAEPLEAEPRFRGAASQSELTFAGVRANVLRVVVLVDGQPQSMGLARAVATGVRMANDSPIYVSHFATCPDRERFRRASRPEG